MATPLLITLNHRGRSVDFDIRVDGPALVGDLVDALVRQAELVGVPRKPSLVVHRTGQTLAREERMSDADLRSGDLCRLNDAPKADERSRLSAVAVAEIVEGPGAGSVFELRPGPSDIGRAEVCEIKIEDRLASRRHVRVDVGEDIQVHDLGSTNGALVNGEEITGVVKVSPDDLLVVGETVLRLRTVEAAEDANRAYNSDRGPFIDTIAGAAGMDRESTIALLDAFSFPEKAVQLSDAWLGGTVQQVMKDQMDFFVAQGEIASALPSYDPFVDTSFLEAVN